MENADDQYPSAFWRDRAEEARTKAEGMISKAGRHSMLEIARLYDGLARRAEKRERARENEQPD